MGLAHLKGFQDTVKQFYLKMSGESQQILYLCSSIYDLNV